ncbi:MAG: hypothetical protein WCN92_07825, partial [Eubacteriales bacterium]
MMENYTNSEAGVWYHEQLEHPESFPFSFTYNGIRYDGFSAAAFRETGRFMSSDEKKETNERVWIMQDGLQVTLRTAYYPVYGASEWTVWFENTGCENSGIIENPESSLTFTGKHPVLKGILGDHVNLYQPYAYDLEELPVHFMSDSGRPTHVNFPYFNLEYGEVGVMLAIGWAGTWTADFTSDGETTTFTARSTAGLRTFLKPGEKIRTALFVRAPYN